MPTKPVHEIKLVDREDPSITFHLWDRFTGRGPLKVLEEKEGRLLVSNGRRLGWGTKMDFFPSLDALPFFGKRVRDFPKDSWAWMMLGICWSMEGEPDTAIRQFNEAIRQKPNFAAAYLYLGDAWSEKKNLEKALQNYAEAFRLDPRDPHAICRCAITKSEMGALNDAIKDFDEAIRLDPTWSDFFSNRGLTWNNLKQADKAIRDFDEALRLNENNAVAFNGRAMSWIYKGLTDKAIQDYGEAIRLDPKDAASLFNRGFLLASTRQYRSARRDFDSILRQGPKNSSALFARSVVLMLEGSPGDAASGFQTVIDLQGWKGHLAPLATILGHFAARQAGDAVAAKRFLDNSIGHLDDDWATASIDYLRGKIDEKTLLRVAGKHEKPLPVRWVIAFDLLLKGQSDKAKAELQWCKDNVDRTTFFHMLAISELERLEKRGSP